MDAWYSFDEGRSIGLRGSEEGLIIRDEEHPEGARITLERDARKPFAITCGVYGWAVHTCFFSDEAVAQRSFDEMKSALETILDMIPCTDDLEAAKKRWAVNNALSAFVERFK